MSIGPLLRMYFFIKLPTSYKKAKWKALCPVASKSLWKIPPYVKQMKLNIATTKRCSLMLVLRFIKFKMGDAIISCTYDVTNHHFELINGTNKRI